MHFSKLNRGPQRKFQWLQSTRWARQHGIRPSLSWISWERGLARSLAWCPWHVHSTKSVERRTDWQGCKKRSFSPLFQGWKIQKKVAFLATSPVYAPLSIDASTSLTSADAKPVSLTSAPKLSSIASGALFPSKPGELQTFQRRGFNCCSWALDHRLHKAWCAKSMAGTTKSAEGAYRLVHTQEIA